jgi:HYR domain
MKILPVLVAAAFFFSSYTGIAQTCTLKCPENIIVKADSTKEGAIVNFPPATTSGDCGTISYSQPSGSFFRIGSHSIVASSPSGQKCSFTVTVTDNEPPVLSPVTLSSKKLWPPSNKMKRVGVFIQLKTMQKKLILY